MEWSEEAEKAVGKVPFFVRKKVRKRVENDVINTGKNKITLSDVKATQARFLKKMSSHIKGYQVDTCFGTGGCPHRAVDSEFLLEKIEQVMAGEDLLGFLTKEVKGDLKFHHEFRISIADCPNACSQPQIKDIGIIGAAVPLLTDEPCTLCGSCVESCRENAIVINNDPPVIDKDRCLYCAKCIEACPTQTLVPGRKGFRIQVGGKLGRHPRLARELPGIYDADQVLAVVKECVAFFKKNSTGGRRFSSLLTESFFLMLCEKFPG